METKGYIAFSGILVSLIVGVTSLVVSYRTSKKTIFINSITTTRLKWIETTRNYLSQFISTINLIVVGSLIAEERRKSDNDLQIIGNNIKLQLNRSDELDSEIISLIDNIQLKSRINHEGIELTIKELVLKSQDLLKFEWERIKEESKSGNLSLREKKRLSKTFKKNS